MRNYIELNFSVSLVWLFYIWIHFKKIYIYTNFKFPRTKFEFQEFRKTWILFQNSMSQTLGKKIVIKWKICIRVIFLWARELNLLDRRLLWSLSKCVLVGELINFFWPSVHVCFWLFPEKYYRVTLANNVVKFWRKF